MEAVSILRKDMHYGMYLYQTNCYINTDEVLQHFKEVSFALRDFVYRL